MFMTDATRQRVPESRAAQSCARPAAADRSVLRSRRPVGEGLVYLSAPGLSLSRTNAATERAGLTRRSQTGIHGETSNQPDRARAEVCCHQRIVHQRGSQPRVAAARARAWVSRNQFGNAP